MDAKLLTNRQKDKQLEQITYLDYRNSCVLYYIVFILHVRILALLLELVWFLFLIKKIYFQSATISF